MSNENRFGTVPLFSSCLIARTNADRRRGTCNTLGGGAVDVEERPGAADAEAERICARVAIASEKEAVPGVALG